jgi:hypothetical protein
MQKQRVLIIGSKDHLRANCYDWLENWPNIEDFDVIIINMHTLSQDIFDKATAKISCMRSSIWNILTSDREVFCIISSMLVPTRPPGSGVAWVVPPPTNFDWFPFPLYVNSQLCGSSYSLIDSRFAPYFETVNKWEHEIDFTNERDVNRLCSFSPIAINKSQKLIAASLRLYTNSERNQTRDGAIHLLPHPTKVSPFQGIEVLLDIILGAQGKFIQPWRRLIEVPKEKELEAIVINKQKEIENINQEILSLKKELQEWDSYRDLLTATGEDLELIVQKTMLDLGIKTERTEKGFPADLINDKVAVEVTGIKGSVGVDSNKVIQTGRFIENFRKNEKVILIVNTYLDTPPNDRKGKMNFSDPMIKYLESISVGFMTTQTLFVLWKEVVLGKRKAEQVKEKILNTTGEITI